MQLRGLRKQNMLLSQNHVCVSQIAECQISVRGCAIITEPTLFLASPS